MPIQGTTKEKGPMTTSKARENPTTTLGILDRLSSLSATVDVSIFRFRVSRYGGPAKWSIELEWSPDTGEMTKVRVKTENENFDLALREAWTKLSVPLQHGFGNNLLAPPVEAKAEETN